MDLSNTYDIPNPYGLRAADFNHQTDSYRAALCFLGDLATGTPEDRALEQNGGSKAMLQAWQRSGNFRHVLAKCRAANAANARHSVGGAESAPTDTGGGERGDSPSMLPPPVLPAPGTQRFVSFEEMVKMLPVVGPFGSPPNPGSWGSA